MFFTKRTSDISHQHSVYVSGEKWFPVSNNLVSGSTQVKQVVAKTKFSLNNFYIYLPEAVKIYFHAMILSHVTHCLPTWSLSSDTMMKPAQAVYKQALGPG